LRLRDVNTLVLTGVATQFAVERTAREAVDRGYRVLVLRPAAPVGFGRSTGSRSM
jgi:nicotinamidase-related amidase